MSPILRLRRLVCPPARALLLLGLFSLQCVGCSPADPDEPDFKWSARVTKAGFELSANGGPWKPFWPIGVNFGTAVPGHSPGEFLATRKQLARWLAVAAESGANCIRTYTVQAPAFYDELRRWNLEHEDNPMFLVQGIWVKEPEGFGPDYLSEETEIWVKDEIDKVVDVVHGNIEIPHGSPERPMNWGRAYGRFDADVSPWMLGWLFGRELEPYTLESTYARHPQAKVSHSGRFLSIEGENGIEAWIVKMMDRIVARDHDKYGEQRPIGFSNWPTLDPLKHWTEPKIPLSAEDTYQVDLEPMTTQGFEAGVYMSYHAYPYYPDFILYQPDYQSYYDKHGVFSYVGYLEELRKHHAKHAVIIAEIGHPSSVGNGHQSPSGQDHGGMSEIQQADAVMRSLAAIHQAGLHGAMVFAIIDEWFKRAWVVERVETPPERRRMWHNVMNPEQNFGLIALRAGAQDARIVLDGKAGDWGAPMATAGQPHPLGDGHDEERRLKDLTVTYDPAFVHVRVRMVAPSSGEIDWSKTDLLVAFDTIDASRGDGRLDPAGKVEVGRRVEHVLRIHHPEDAQLLVDKPFDLYGLWHGFREPWQKYRSTKNDEGVFNLVRTITNAAYEVKDEDTGDWTTLGELKVQETGRFAVGSEEKNSSAMVAINEQFGVIEIRVPWNLLHFTDPSSRLIVDDDGSLGEKKVFAATTSEIAVAVVVLGGDAEQETTLTDSIPAAQKTVTGHKLPAQGWAVQKLKGWEKPAYHERNKPIVGVLGEGVAAILPPTIAVPVVK